MTAAPDGILENINCGCKSGCSRRCCSCQKAEMKCTGLCSCCDCTNSPDQNTDVNDLWDDDDDLFFELDGDDTGQCSRSVFIWLIQYYHSDPQYLYYKHSYLSHGQIFRATSSMVMIGKPKCTLAKLQIYKKKSTSVGMKNQVESFLVVLDSD
jgi:hypothetical protein